MTIQDRLSNIKKLISHLHYASMVDDAADEVMKLVRSGVYNFPIALLRVSKGFGLPKEDIQAELQRRRKMVNVKEDIPEFDPYLNDVLSPDEERAHVLDYLDPSDED